MISISTKIMKCDLDRDLSITRSITLMYWFQLLEDLVRRHMQREGFLRGFCRRRQPGGRGRKSLLKPRAKQGILAPTPRPSPPWDAGRVVRIETPGGQLEEVALPSNMEDIRRQTLFERTRALLREAEDGTPAPSAEDIRNRLIRLHPQPRSQESRGAPVSTPRGTPPRPRAGPSRRRNEPDFPSGQYMIGSAPAVRFLTGPVPLRPIPYHIRRPQCTVPTRSPILQPSLPLGGP